MNQSDLDQLFKAVSQMSFTDHMKFFDQFRSFTFERLSSDSKSFAANAKEIDEFVKAKLA